jgi:hypothetical protein
MQEVTLWFWAALSVVLIVTSFVDSQEVILVEDPDISPVGQVRKSPKLIGLHSNCFKSFRVRKCEQEACAIQQQQMWSGLKTGFEITLK